MHKTLIEAKSRSFVDSYIGVVFENILISIQIHSNNNSVNIILCRHFAIPTDFIKHDNFNKGFTINTR